MKLNLLVIRTDHPEKLKEQYERIGFRFIHHQHGNGPFHFSSDQDGLVLEIYPLMKTQNTADNSLRMGFEIEDLTSLISQLKNSNWKIIAEPKKTEWGLQAIIQDLDGRKIELKNK